MKVLKNQIISKYNLGDFSETLKEKENREKYCGLKPKNFNNVLYPWYVGLRLIIGSEKYYFTGTLISNSYVVTAASTFDKDPLSIWTESDWKDKQYWAALPGAYNIPNIDEYSPFGHYFTADWSDIIRIEIHPLYNSDHHR